MPTISQLPSASQVTAADLVPVSQAGTAHSVSVGTLLGGMQPAILAPTGCVLGRTSMGPGGPEPLMPGPGLVLNGATLAATGTDHANFPVQATLAATDRVVLSSDGQPRLAEAATLRQLFSAGSNIAISASGTISASSGGSGIAIAALPAATAPGTQDLLAISQAGTECAISYAALIDGLTIDLAAPAQPAQDGDQFWVAQGSATMARQDLAALWVWITSKLPAVSRPVVELSVDTTLDTTVHNGRILVCSQPLNLLAAVVNLGSGFVCDVINVSSGAITLEGTMLTSTGASTIPAGQVATLRCAGWSGGSVIHAAISGGAGAASPPAAVTALSATGITQSGVTLNWIAVAGAASYAVQYRAQGASQWNVAASALNATSFSIAGLLPGTAYDFAVLAVNSAGSSPATTVSATTAAQLAVPGPPSGVAAGSVMSNAVTVSWSAPTSGGAVASYTVQFRISGGSGWTSGGSNIATTQFTVAGLAANTAYEFQVFAANAAGAGPVSSVVSARTSAAAGSVTAITWNVAPTATYVHGVGSIGVNAHVTPATAAVRFGFSTSSSVQPASWVTGSLVNSDLWGAYVSIPATAGIWYAWCSGTDGSSPVVYPTGFTVT